MPWHWPPSPFQLSQEQVRAEVGVAHCRNSVLGARCCRHLAGAQRESAALRWKRHRIFSWPALWRFPYCVVKRCSDTESVQRRKLEWLPSTEARATYDTITSLTSVASDMQNGACRPWLPRTDQVWVLWFVGGCRSNTCLANMLAQLLPCSLPLKCLICSLQSGTRPHRVRCATGTWPWLAPSSHSVSLVATSQACRTQL